MSDILKAALSYREAGFSVIPLRGKVCPIRWAKYQHQAATLGEIHNWHNAGLMSNVGIVCGAVSGNLAVIDLDGDDAIRTYQRAFTFPVPTTHVRTGSGVGMHIYYRCRQLPPTTRTKGYELRADGCYVVAPPSIHPDTGAPYVPSFGFEHLAIVPDLYDVRGWIAQKINLKRTAVEQEAAATPVRDASAYGRRALENAIAAVRLAGPGRQNNELNRQAFKMGFMVERGHLDYHQVIRELAFAASDLSERDGDRATLATIKSGLHAGMERSRAEIR